MITSYESLQQDYAWVLPILQVRFTFSQHTTVTELKTTAPRGSKTILSVTIKIYLLCRSLFEIVLEQDPLTVHNCCRKINGKLKENVLRC